MALTGGHVAGLHGAAAANHLPHVQLRTMRRNSRCADLLMNHSDQLHDLEGDPSVLK